MKREIVAEGKLLKLINEKFDEYDEDRDFEDSRVYGIRKLAELDANGCNWSESPLVSNCNSEECKRIALKAVNEIRKKYNLE